MEEVILDGIKFRKDANTGYYLGSKTVDGERMRLHRYVWYKHNGSIPKGYQVHHIDHNKDNNDISNLKLMTEHDHLSLENKFRRENDKEWVKNFHEAGIAAAPKWHASKAGKKWHTDNYLKIRNLWMSRVNKKCIVCGKEYSTTHASSSHSKFCSNNCKSKWRRNHHLDDSTRRCVICGKSFTTNKYSKAKTCSRKCATISTARTKTNKSKIS